MRDKITIELLKHNVFSEDLLKKLMEIVEPKVIIVDVNNVIKSQPKTTTVIF